MSGDGRVNRKREWLAGILLGAVSILASLVLLEVGVRMLHLLPDRFWEHDPLLGVRLQPGASGWWSQEEREFVVPVAINTHGRRDVERTWEKPAATRRLLVLGDSYVEAMQVPLEQTFAHLLENRLNADGGAPIEVLNGGVSGYGTGTATLFFERDGHRYQPDLVLLAFYPGNDILNNSPTLEDRFPPIYDDAGRLLRVDGPSREDTGGPEWKTYRYLRKLVLTRQPQLAALLSGLGLMRHEAIRQVAESDGIPVAYGGYEVPLSEPWEDAWQRTEGLLDRLRASVEAHEARFAVAIVSIRDQVYPELWQEIVAQHPNMRRRTWDLGAPAARMRAWCSRRGVACVDLAPEFSAVAAKSAERLHFRHDGHWTAAGHELATSLLGEFITRQRLLPPNDSMKQGGT